MASINLKVTPDQLKKKSGEIKKEIKAIENDFTKVDEYVTGTKKYWEGEASDVHIKGYNKMKDDFKTIIKRLKEHPKDLETMAGVYEDTENSIKTAISGLPTDVI
ncbi:MAG: WXG100 family type VII secretion target [Lachnospiraceae bacterium]|nr:WXG100 family type VII secretion target [Lachnospiraceae bacterium]